MNKLLAELSESCAGSHWYCKVCNNVTSNIIDGMSKMEQRVLSVEKALQEKNETNKTKLQSMESKLTEQIRRKSDDTEAQLLIKDIETKLEAHKKEILEIH